MGFHVGRVAVLAFGLLVVVGCSKAPEPRPETVSLLKSSPAGRSLIRAVLQQEESLHDILMARVQGNHDEQRQQLALRGLEIADDDEFKRIIAAYQDLAGVDARGGKSLLVIEPYRQPTDPAVGPQSHKGQPSKPESRSRKEEPNASVIARLAELKAPVWNARTILVRWAHERDGADDRCPELKEISERKTADEFDRKQRDDDLKRAQAKCKESVASAPPTYARFELNIGTASEEREYDFTRGRFCLQLTGSGGNQDQYLITKVDGSDWLLAPRYDNEWAYMYLRGASSSDFGSAPNGKPCFLLGVPEAEARTMKARLMAAGPSLRVMLLFEALGEGQTPWEREARKDNWDDAYDRFHGNGKVRVKAFTGRAVAYRLQDREGEIRPWTPFEQ